MYCICPFYSKKESAKFFSSSGYIDIIVFIYAKKQLLYTILLINTSQTHFCKPLYLQNCKLSTKNLIIESQQPN